MKTTSQHNQQPRARIQVRRGTYRNQPGYHILGKAADGSSVRIFSSDTTGAEARRMVGELKAGKSPHFDEELRHNAAKEQCFACDMLDRYMTDPRNACFCTSEQSARKSMRNSAATSARDEAIERAMAMMQEIADTMRETTKSLIRVGRVE